MLTIQQARFEAARAVVEDEGMRIHREIEEYRSGARGLDDIDYGTSLDDVRTRLRALDLPGIVMLGVEARIAHAMADEAMADGVSEVLQRIRCDFIDLRDWRPANVYAPRSGLAGG